MLAVYQYIPETVSTNQLMKDIMKLQQMPEALVIQTAYQTGGKGQAGNSWESAKDKNLLFSILLYPNFIPAEQQFLISQMVSLGVINGLQKVLSGNPAADNFSLKWPNDIYWKDLKLGGILIENTWRGSAIASTIAGIGLNINQEEFLSDAPNPVSLFQITGQQFELREVLTTVVEAILYQYQQQDHHAIRKNYMRKLYRNEGLWNFRDASGVFEAQINAVMPDGCLQLCDTSGILRNYYFKEVEFILPASTSCF
jgi:BirA family biotin operon repressor/biotin-[acetyl-CoA-carboxylase] ligase